MMKYIKIAGLVILILLLGTIIYFYNQYTPTPKDQQVWGITFSHRHAASFGYDWKTVYLDMLNDLKPTKLRLMAYWEDIEPQQNTFDFSVPAQLIVEAQRRNIEVILVVGHKQPRWPECHHPDWYTKLGSQEEKNAAQLNMVKNAVDYYKQFTAITTWQVENEAMFSFGYDCPQTPRTLIEQEMAIVRAADPRPILLSDSGEFGRWLPINSLNPEVFGSTMYRVVHSPKFGYFKYPLPPEFFRVKAGVLNVVNPRPIIGVELQAEPWFADDLFTTPLTVHYQLMNPKIFEEYTAYAQKVGFQENYLWGVEWWYWMAKQNNDWGMWESAKQLLSK